MPSYAVWETVVFLLNALAFVLIGLQVGPILDRLGPAQRVPAFAFAAAVLVTTMLARAAWVMTCNRALWLTNLILAERTPQTFATPPLKRAAVVAWCGMRGIVTLAAALALPNGSGGAPAFPYRDVIVLTAFTVVLGTLVIQGLSLRPLVLALGLDEDEAVGDETRAGREEIFKAALRVWVSWTPRRLRRYIANTRTYWAASTVPADRGRKHARLRRLCANAPEPQRAKGWLS